MLRRTLQKIRFTHSCCERRLILALYFAYDDAGFLEDLLNENETKERDDLVGDKHSYVRPKRNEKIKMTVSRARTATRSSRPTFERSQGTPQGSEPTQRCPVSGRPAQASPSPRLPPSGVNWRGYPHLGSDFRSGELKILQNFVKISEIFSDF